ncbi:putative carboxypeptidase [Hyphodiscus hymeniophilus]|uniref:Carboxypeptidase n=1 Tax=Hyphodiscus hymeniophilus TaxID=353542 RepID=A0A9P6VR22_9HELO|nr:putative carboxypeptidase [Hyphodiscus hymeniophilus]
MALKAPNYTLLPQGETDPLTSTRQRTQVNWRRLYQWAIPVILSIAVILALIITNIAHTGTDSDWDHHSSLPACPQYPALVSSTGNKKFEKDVLDEISSEGFFGKSVKRMQGAVQIPTESFDDMGKVGADDRWNIFVDFHAYLEKTFPLVYSKLEISHPNTYGILIEWKGKDESLKPYLFMGHQDVVPVPKVTESRWKYPPYSAHYDDRFIWGRGASDCKNVVIGVLEAFETLLEKDYIPERTMMAGFGFDEEISGWQGAFYIAKQLEDTKGKDSFELIIDEGGLGIKEMYGSMFVLPGVGEKGYHDIKITVETAGGHSSVPPDHSGIGILSQIVSAIEAKPYAPNLTPINPYFTTLQCGAEYGPSMDSWLRKTIKKSLTSKAASKKVAEYLSNDNINQRYLMQTSQAVDLINGGVKINALPERVFAVINHRIAVESRTKDVRENIQTLLQDQILKKFSMSLNAWGNVSGNTSSSAVGQVILEDFDEPLEPSPVSPFDSEAYKTFTGTIKQTFGEDYIVAPSFMTGNTDTKYFWNLSKNIYRFSPVRDDGRANAHTVDERVGMKEHIEGVKFYTQLIFNGDRK